MEMQQPILLDHPLTPRAGDGEKTPLDIQKDLNVKLESQLQELNEKIREADEFFKKHEAVNQSIEDWKSQIPKEPALLTPLTRGREVDIFGLNDPLTDSLFDDPNFLIDTKIFGAGQCDQHIEEAFGKLYGISLRDAPAIVQDYPQYAELINAIAKAYIKNKNDPPEEMDTVRSTVISWLGDSERMLACEYSMEWATVVGTGLSDAVERLGIV